MALDQQTIQDKLVTKFGENVVQFHVFDMLNIEVPSEICKDVITFLKEDEVLQFDFLTDLCGVHYPSNPKEKEFEVVYLLHNWFDNVRVRVRTYLSLKKLEIPTIVDVFAAANWLERETYDFYGIIFLGHPNLKRILNDEHMTSFPMRKEYPVEDAERTDKDDRFFGRFTNNNQE